MDRKTLRQHEDKILIGLVDFYYEHGHKSETYMNLDTGGIYENKLGHKLGYEVTPENMPAPEFVAAAQLLEANGYVRRIKRVPDSPLLGIWPTQKGLDRAEYLKANWFEKVKLTLRENRTSIAISAIISAITTIIALAIASVFKLFGMGS